MTKTILTISLLAAFVSCETVPEPTAEETRQTKANIAREQASFARRAADTRQEADDLLDAAQGYDSYYLEREAARNRDEAENLDTARRQMGRGAAN